MAKDILNCGIVGYGYMGEIRHRVADQHRELNLIGIVETDPKKCTQIQGVPVLQSVDELLSKDVDLIFVCTPNKYSPEICIQSMEQGKHVFCEKPPGQNLVDIERIRAHETEATKLMFGFNHRFHPGIVKAKVLVEGGSLGKIVSVRGIYGKSGGISFPKSWRNDKSVSGGGILLDQGIHMMDLFLYFCGDFKEVKAFTSNKYWNFEVEDNAMVILKNSQDQLATMHSSATLWKHQFQIDITLEKGYMKVQGLLSKSGSYGRETLVIGRQQFEDQAYAVGNPSEEIIYFDCDDSWDIEVNEIVRCIKENKPVTNSNSLDAYKVMKVIDLAYKDSRAESQTVRGM